ncbi:hypothetical protein CHU98_g10515 [Xylaria longipes]|nr:hypothetical protein CHU98_g10515 [Xylaria longipes]
MYKDPTATNDCLFVHGCLMYLRIIDQTPEIVGSQRQESPFIDREDPASDTIHDVYNCTNFEFAISSRSFVTEQGSGLEHSHAPSPRTSWIHDFDNVLGLPRPWPANATAPFGPSNKTHPDEPRYNLMLPVYLVMYRRSCPRLTVDGSRPSRGRAPLLVQYTSFVWIVADAVVLPCHAALLATG